MNRGDARHYGYGGYVWRNALADLRHRYAGSVGGALWNVLQPLLMIAVFTVIFTGIMRRPGAEEAPYVVYLCSALLPWYALAECLNRGTHALTAHALHLRKTAIPEAVFVAQATLSAALGLAIALAILLGVGVCVGMRPSWTWALVPVPCVLLLAMGLGVSLALSAVHVFIRDIGQALPVMLQVGFWSYPIVYRAQDVPEWMRRVLPYNPVYPALTGVRELFLHGRVPGGELWFGMMLWAAAALLAGSMVMRRLRPEIRDVI